MARRQATAVAERRCFVGRAAELAQLEETLEEALAGEVRAVTLAGEPGIGKSRTAEELAARARDRGALVVEGAGFDGDGAPPLWPWVQVLRACADACDPAQTDGVDALSLAVVAGAVPELAAGRRRLPAVPPLEPAAERFRLLDAIARLLYAVARRQPLLVVLDDLHWADVASLLLLQLVLRSRTAAALMVLGAYRDLDLKRNGELAKVMAEIERLPRVRLVALPGLAESECDEMTRALAPQISAPLRHWIWRESEGTPFFVEALTRHVVERDGGGLDTSPEESHSMPESLRDLLRRRVQSLSGFTRDVLGAAAVIGREFDAALIARIVDQRDPQTDRLPLVDAFEEATRARIVESHGASGRYRFTHALQRDALYDDLPGRLRIELHHGAARAIEELYAGDLQARLGDLAHHYFEAALAGTASEAVDYARRAAAMARRLCAFDEAARQLENSLIALDLTEQPSERERCQILLELGEAQALLGVAEKSRGQFERALHLARRLGDAKLFGRAVLAAHGLWGTVGAANLEYVALVEEALAGLPAEELELRVYLMGRLATELYWTPQQERREAIGREMIALARESGSAEFLARALNSAHFALWRPENAIERLALARENSELGERTGDRHMVAGGLIWQVIDLVELGRMAEASTAIDAYGVQAAHLQGAHFLWQHGVLQTMRALVEGRLEEAERLAQEALSTGLGTQEVNAEMFFGVQMVELCWHRGRLDQLEEAVRSFVAQLPGIPAWRAALAFILTEQEKLREAAAELDVLAADGFAAIPHDANLLISAAMLAEVCAALGDGERAAQVYALAQPYAEQIVVAGNGAAMFGAVAYFLGRLAVAMGTLEKARDHLEAALAIHMRMGARPHAARTALRLAELLVMSGAAADPRVGALLEQVTADAESIGMGRLLQQTAALRAKIAAPPPERAAEASVVPGAGGSDAAMLRLFRRAGDYWMIGSAEDPLRLADSIGLQCLAFLLRRPGEDVAATDLTDLRAGGRAAAAAVAGEGADLVVRGDAGDAGEMLDPQARAAYKARLRELREDLDEAERFNDTGRAEMVRAEMETLSRELSRAFGLGGRQRRAASHAERARVNVTRAIKKAVGRIARHDPALAHHLDNAIHTGRFCRYVPDPNNPLRWEL